MTVLAIAAFWTWLGSPVPMPYPSGQGQKLYCVSYTPFRGGQTPLDLSTMVPAAQIDEDLAALAKITDCVRTYSVDFGLDQIAGIAARHGLKVIQGLWLSSHPERNRYQIDTAVALANQYPDTIRAVVVGNEVLLRGEMSAADLARTIRSVKARVPMPVTYADVWEFWLRNSDLAGAVDFITIHILPYWEDFPIGASRAAAHVDAIRQKIADAFPGKQVLIGEVGWPSAGRMRQDALPSRVNQARVLQDVLALSRRENFRVNLIEAYDQPWKRALEGTVGGHWGILDGSTRAPKFAWGQPVSNHPNWLWQGLGGILFAVAVFAAAIVAGRKDARLRQWLAVGANALAGGALIGWTVENVPLESLGLAGWGRSLAIAGIAIAAPALLSIAVVRGNQIASLSRIIGLKQNRESDPVALLSGILLTALIIMSFVVALGLVFDPRYRDFPFAPLTAGIVPFVMHRLVRRKSTGTRSVSEFSAGIVLGLSAVYVALNEGFANWQSLWLCAALAVLALNLIQVHDAQSS